MTHIENIVVMVDLNAGASRVVPLDDCRGAIFRALNGDGPLLCTIDLRAAQIFILCCRPTTSVSLYLVFYIDIFKELKKKKRGSRNIPNIIPGTCMQHQYV